MDILSGSYQHQIFLDVFRAIRQFDPAKGPFKSWLLMFAYHRTFNLRRSLVAGHFFESDSLDEVWTARSAAR